METSFSCNLCHSPIELYLNEIQDFFSTLTQLKEQDLATLDLQCPSNCSYFACQGTSLSQEESDRPVEEFIKFLRENSMLDNLLCIACSDQIICELEARIKDTEEEVEALKCFIKPLQYREEEELEKDLQKLLSEEAELQQELETKKQEVSRLESELNRIKKSCVELQSSLEKQSYADIEARYEREASQGESARLDFTVIGPFATINRLRLGRLPEAQVDWHEINAAWGYTLWFLSAMADKMGFAFGGYKLVFLGSRSEILQLDSGQRWGLWAPGGFKALWARRFDQAALLFLRCLRQFERYLAHIDYQVELPYEISGEMVGGKRLRLQAPGTEVEWTAACRHTLLNLKWCLAWLRKIIQDDGELQALRILNR
ncbi:beclin-1-like protein isoform X3 [Zophobas morio]|uniref:beclin-1-like protein isoform X3 n=1 Tax=Zophobas morio TaxID=2755281 RepID=UPI003082A51B